MTRINTNVSSLVARNTLGRSNAALEQSLTRLSTGLRINTGKDDPAGLIASENLRSDITSIRKAISNTDRANQVIATADSALGQVSSLLNDIRGLVTESANSGALSDAQISANQLQLDSSLEALNRIAQTTTFQGRKLLDGSLDFTTTAGTNFSRISSLNIDQANLGATGSVAVTVAISAAATQAQVNVTNVPVATASSAASTTATFTNTVVQSVNTLTISGDAITITSQSGGAHEGDSANSPTDVAVVFGGAAGAVYDTGTGVLTVTVAGADGVATTADIAAAIDGTANFVATGGDTSTVSAAQATAATLVNATAGRDAGSSAIAITSANAGTSFNGKTVTVTESNTVTTAAPTATVDGSGNITVLINDTGTTTLSAVRNAIDGLADYNASLTTTTGDGNYNAVTQTAPVVANTSGGAVATGGITSDLVFELAGADGSEVFSVLAGASIGELIAQINQVSDATGVTATASSTTLQLKSSAYGSNAFVDLNIISEGAGSGTFTTAVGQGSRVAGVDVVAKVNGINANGNGNRLSINTATIDLGIDLDAAFIGNIAFTITGGGALFQLGPDVVSNQQSRIGIGSVNTAKLGGVSGLLFQLASGGESDLATDASTASDIVGEAIDQVTTLRGRLGAFQRTLLETNKNALNDTLINLSDAESQIRDADFAAESAALTRAQILVQSGTTVLQIANSNPQNVLALLRG